MLFSEPCALTRVQCAFVDTPEVKRIVDYIASQPSPTGMPYSLPDYEESGGASASAGGGVMDSGLGSESGPAMKYDALFAEIARDAVGGGDNFSVSYIQRCFSLSVQVLSVRRCLEPSRVMLRYMICLLWRQNCRSSE